MPHTNEETTARDHLEQIPPDQLTDGQHIALALHTLCDIVYDYLVEVGAKDDDDDGDEYPDDDDFEEDDDQ